MTFWLPPGAVSYVPETQMRDVQVVDTAVIENLLSTSNTVLEEIKNRLGYPKR